MAFRLERGALMWRLDVVHSQGSSLSLLAAAYMPECRDASLAVRLAVRAD
ncbi:hypothetical protein HaLaN_32656, partial [Haematococcus lacustris]